MEKDSLKAPSALIPQDRRDSLNEFATCRGTATLKFDVRKSHVVIGFGAVLFSKLKSCDIGLVTSTSLLLRPGIASNLILP